MYLAEFDATYVTTSIAMTVNVMHCQLSDSETTFSQTKLTDGYGKMNKRKQAVIRFRWYNKHAEPSNWYRAKLMLYYPWYNERTDLLGSYSTYEEHYRRAFHCGSK